MCCFFVFFYIKLVYVIAVITKYFQIVSSAIKVSTLGVFDKDEFIVQKLQNPIQGALKSLIVRHRSSNLISLTSDLHDC
jgi:hypothetical protein